MHTKAHKTHKVGVVGLGHFGRKFVELFKAHPLCSDVVLCEKRKDVLDEMSKEYGIAQTYADFDELLKSDVDAVAIYTQRWSHAPMAIKALKHGKHVYSAVPAAVTLEELDELVKTVEETGLTYALGETSFYRAPRIYCRERFSKGDFGKFVYGEGHYYHDMAGWFYLPFYDANGADWKRYASVPPMWYPTHSVSHVLGVTMSRMTHVSSFGYHDDPNEADGLFDAATSPWGNDFSNQSALFRTADGGMARINEFRRIGAGESRQTIMGTRAAYQEQASPSASDETVADQITGATAKAPQSSAVWTQNSFTEPPYDSDGNFDYVNAQHNYKKIKENLTDKVHLFNEVEITAENIDRFLCDFPKDCIGKRFLGIIPGVHPIERLPHEFLDLPNGHAGSHHFLVDDFLTAMSTGLLPPNHVWISARYNAPGIVAHESCKREGERLAIPDFGKPPVEIQCLDPLVDLED